MDSRDRDKTAANLLRGSLRDTTDACPDPEILAAYCERTLDAEERAHFELHLSECGRCREQLAAMDRAAVAAGEDAARGSVRRPSLWNWRWLAPVVAAMVIGAIWIGRRPTSVVTVVQNRSAAVAPQAPAPLPTPLQDEKKKEEREALPATPAANAARQSAPLEKTLQSPVNRIGTRQEPSQPSAGTFEPADKPNRDFAPAKQSTNAKQAAGAAISSSAAPVPSGSAPAAPPPSLAANAPQSKADSSLRASADSETDAVAQESPRARANSDTVAVGSSRAKTAPAPMMARNEAQPTNTSASLQGYALVGGLPANVIGTSDPKVIWRIGRGGAIERTENGGGSWKAQTPQPNAQFTAGSAPSAKICWLVGSNGLILLTNNAKKWSVIAPPVSADFTAVTAINDLSAVVTASDGRKYATSDGGKHWESAR